MEHRKFLITFAVISVAIGCCISMVFYPLLEGKKIFNTEPAPEEINQSFLNALVNDDYSTAFDLCGDLLQEDLIDPLHMQAEIEENQLQPVSWKVLSQSISPDEVEYIGSMDFLNHINGTFRITLRHYEDGWKVAVFFLTLNAHHQDVVPGCGFREAAFCTGGDNNWFENGLKSGR